MLPFKKRLLLLFIPVILVVAVCIYRTNAKYENIVEYKYKLGDEFEFNGAKVTVNSAEVIDSDYIEEKYGDNDMVMSAYDTYSDDTLVMIKLDVEGINQELFRSMVNNWHIIIGNNGNGVAYISDFANGEFTEKKEDKELVLFFMVLDKWLEESDDEIMIMSNLYPEQHNVYIDLKE